jgi:O-phosphoseryl-tRNA(Cys) synthetase
VARIHEKHSARHTIESLIEAIIEDIKRPNVLHTAIGLFSSYIRMKYAETINPTQVTINRVKKDFEELTQILKDCIVLYYNLDKIEDLFDT